MDDPSKAINAKASGGNPPASIISTTVAFALARGMTMDEIDIELADGKPRYEALMCAAQSRLRPVMMAAATTVFGVVPLLPDVFQDGMTVTNMVGLTVGSFPTMILLPVFHAIFYNVKGVPEQKPASGALARS